MNSFEAYCAFMGIRLHFTKEYNYPKYGYRKANIESFRAKGLESKFSILSKENDVELYVASNFFRNNSIWVNEIVDKSCKKIYNKSLSIIGSAPYYIKNALSQFSSLDDAFVVHNNRIPKILESYYAGDISPEVIAIIVDSLKLDLYWDSYLKEDPLWIDNKNRIKKYLCYIRYDKQKIHDTINTFNTEKNR